MDNKKKKTFNKLSILFAVIGVICLCLSVYFVFFSGGDSSDYEEYVVTTGITQTTIETTEEVEEYISPIDFETLQAENPDVCAWIEIVDSDISYPILCSQTDNSTYLQLDMYGNYDSSGEIFIENYNEIDFSDPATIIYGHNMLSGAKFGYLQEYFSNYEYFYEHNIINIYLPNETKQYQIFAAVPYDTSHILYYNDFSNEEVFDNFIEEILSIRSLSAVIDDSVTVTSSDKLIILSTCANSGTSRFLVLAIEKSTN